MDLGLIFSARFVSLVVLLRFALEVGGPQTRLTDKSPPGVVGREVDIDFFTSPGVIRAISWGCGYDAESLACLDEICSQI